MGFCPFRSTRYYRPDTINISQKTVTGELVDYNGDPPSAASDGLAFQIDSIDAGIDTVNGTEIVTTVDCVQNTTCQIWDDVNSRCGMLVSNTIIAPTDESNHLLANLEGVIGKLSQRDSGNTLVQYLKTILGVDGESRESLMKIIEHIHNMHDHPVLHNSFGGAYNNTTHGDYIGGIPPAATLMQEYLTNSDQDNISVATLQTVNASITGSIYGLYFRITEDANIPPMLKAIHTNPDFPTGTPEITWVQYISL